MCKYCESSKMLSTKPDSGLRIEENKDGSFYLRTEHDLVSKINFCPICGKKLTPFDNIDTDS